MTGPRCGHALPAADRRLCPHLLDEVVAGGGHLTYVRLLRGRAIEHDDVCQTCALSPSPPLLDVCVGCADQVRRYGASQGWVGTPEIEERPEEMDLRVTRVVFPEAIGTVIDAAPVVDAPGCQWLLLTSRREVVRFDADSGAARVVGVHGLPDEPPTWRTGPEGPRTRVLTDRRARWAAVVHDFGRHGQVLDTSSGEVVLQLDGGPDHPDTVPFGLAFVERHGRTILVHRTDWNRLDALDLASGCLLSARPHTERGHTGESPPHYLDCYLGAVHPSPSGRWAAVDGWVWNPIAVVLAWRLDRWVDGSPWELEDRAKPLVHGYTWDRELCWWDDSTLLVGGIGGEDDEPFLGGVRIIDVERQEESPPLAGPSGSLFAHGGRLYSCDETGVQVWDLPARVRTGRLAGFRPSVLHAGTGELTQLVEDGLLRWRCR